MQVLIEPVFTNRRNWDCLQVEQYTSLLEQFDAEDLGIVLDLFNVGFSDSIERNLDRFSERIQLLQISDGRIRNHELVRCLPGDGEIPIQDWMKKIKSLGYSGDIEIELHGFEFEDSDYLATFGECEAFVSKLVPDVIPSLSSR